ncbi:uncharacterized protein RAG0_16068 [Rhynchosporium agropyri]|uniref:Uncharacterized protein n=1 Tax=Rhynchosporium agropyri TaxID=914238 RepID=A0A1E1LNP2_9HELO|nr:uncharacterized protein RAG0_16068 [Rhynchosporium agropyri]
MFSASWRVYSEVPELFDGFLRPFFLIPQEPSQSLTGLYNKRACCAMAEIFISYLLTVGWSLDDIQRGFEYEVDKSRHTGEFDTKFLLYCLRIYHNLRRAGQFADFAKGNLISGRENSFGIGADQPWCNSFLDPAIVKQYGRDDEIRSEMDRCDAPDRQTEGILHDMRTQLHREAERKWQAKAAEISDGNPSFRGPSLSRTPGSAPPPQSGRRVTFPYEPTMTESSVSGSRNRRNNRNTETPYGEARGRSISRSAPTFQPTTSTSHAHGKWRFPNDPSKDLAISPLRITSPGGTITTMSTSGASTVAKPVYNRPGNWLRQTTIRISPGRGHTNEHPTARRKDSEVLQWLRRTLLARSTTERSQQLKFLVGPAGAGTEQNVLENPSELHLAVQVCQVVENLVLGTATVDDLVLVVMIAILGHLWPILDIEHREKFIAEFQILGVSEPGILN